MSDRTQIGPEVDAALWKRFREDVKARKGTVRGNLGHELETAIRQYLDGGEPTSAGRIDERLSRIEAAVGAASPDGGADTLAERGHTHAPPPPSEKPPANAATDKKVRYLAECLLDKEVPHCRELATVPEESIRDVVIEEYGFRRDTAKRYVDALIEHFELMRHPNSKDILVSEEQFEDLQSESADEQLEALGET